MKNDVENQDTLIIRALLVGPNVSTLHKDYLLLVTIATAVTCCINSTNSKHLM